jgi:hypothetical protein
MTVSVSTMEELKRMEAALPLDRDGTENLRIIETVDELFGFIVADARAAGDDEADPCEMLARHASMTPDEVRPRGELVAVIVACVLQTTAGMAQRYL